jgi:hypothetical protein
MSTPNVSYVVINKTLSNDLLHYIAYSIQTPRLFAPLFFFTKLKNGQVKGNYNLEAPLGGPTLVISL